MANLTNKKISETYEALLKTSNNETLNATPTLLTDGAGNSSGLTIDNAGNLEAAGNLSFGTGLIDTSNTVIIKNFIDEADGIANNDNDFTIPTSAAIKDYVDNNITAQDLDFQADSGTGDVDLDSEIFEILGSNGLSTTASNNKIVIDGITLETAINTNSSDIQDNADEIVINRDDITLNATAISNNASDIATNTSNINTNAAQIATNVTNISNNASNITTNATNISTNSSEIANNQTDIANNSTAIATNVTNISTNATNISNNSQEISINATDISNNTQGINDNAADITLNGDAIVVNATNISTNATDISNLQTDVANKVSKTGDTMSGDLTIDDAKLIVNQTNNDNGVEITDGDVALGTNSGTSVNLNFLSGNISMGIGTTVNSSNIYMGTFDSNSNNKGRLTTQNDSRDSLYWRSYGGNDFGLTYNKLYTDASQNEIEYERLQMRNNFLSIGGVNASEQGIGNVGRLRFLNLNATDNEALTEQPYIESAGNFSVRPDSGGNDFQVANYEQQDFTALAVGTGNTVFSGNNLTVGLSNENSMFNTIVGGTGNVASQRSLGVNNLIGGKDNQLQEKIQNSLIVGENNTARGQNNIVGGRDNIDQITDSTSKNNLLAGYSNSIEGTDLANSILTGTNNTIWTNNIDNVTCLGSVNNVGNTLNRNFSANNSIVTGNGNNIATTTESKNSFISGLSNTVNASQSIALGNQNNVTGNNSLAMGQGNTSSGLRSVSIGYNSTVTSNNGVVIGNDNVNNGGNNSIVIGTQNNANPTSGNANYIFGQGNSITGANSQNNTITGTSSSISNKSKMNLLGAGLSTNSVNFVKDTVLTGVFNKGALYSDPSFVVGAGSSFGSVQNAIEVYKGTGTTNNQIVIPRLQDFADDSAAATGGIELMGLYHKAGTVRIRIT